MKLWLKQLILAQLLVVIKGENFVNEIPFTK